MEFEELKALKVKMWEIIVRENIIVTNGNIDWLLERALKELKYETIRN